MKVAVIKTGGKQYLIKEGDKITIEKLKGKEESKMTFEEVLFVGDEKKVEVGNSLIKGAKIEGKIIEQKKGKKVVGIKHKAKKRQLKKFGHRQQQTVVEIMKI